LRVLVHISDKFFLRRLSLLAAAVLVLCARKKMFGGTAAMPGYAVAVMRLVACDTIGGEKNGVCSVCVKLRLAAPVTCKSIWHATRFENTLLAKTGGITHIAGC
jgi:hypothetical protein